MKTAALFATLALALTSAQAMAPIPKEHHARFLEERAQLEGELAAWKRSDAGRVAQANKYYTEDSHESDAALNDQLSRFFLSKLSIEKSQAENPQATFSVDSPFTLMTEEEFARFVARSGPIEAHAPNSTVEEATRAAAASVDWTTDSKCVGAVKDQAYCGGCWAFSSIGALESAICLKSGNLTALSEQQLISCDYDDSGCGGGLITTGIGYLQDQGSVSTQASYPYVSGRTKQDEKCTVSSSSHEKVKFSISRVVSPSSSEASFLSAITKQPIGVAIAAGNRVFKQYNNGVLSSCSSSQLDHAVIAVGYDSGSFKIRNSWGSSWGDNGYVHLARLSSTKGACGVLNSYAAYPVLA